MVKDEAYRKAEKAIEEAQRTGATTLVLSGIGLTVLPESVGQLTKLQTLNLHRNRLTTLPDALGQLTLLLTLDLTFNQLTALPNSLGRLARLKRLFLSENRLTALPESLEWPRELQRLDLSRNQLTALPKSLGWLTHLKVLDLSFNQLTALPDSLGHLALVWELDLSHNRLTALPDSLGHLALLKMLDISGNSVTALPQTIEQLTWLQTLNLSRNQLTALPESLGQLTRLQMLNLHHNQLIPELAAAYEDGIEAVKAYLRELAKGARERYEAKLLILGDGNEGKTCVSRALRGLPFGDQETTRGVDVEEWEFPHPDDPEDEEKAITLNIWDFEGQEINHHTHQFFLTSDSLYLLVFRCRDQFLLERAEYWLDTIRARAPKARVAIVITQCEARTPYVPEDQLQAEYGDVLVDGQWLFPVGCADPPETSGIPALQAALMRWTGDLEFMGRKWPNSYRRAESVLEDKATSADVSHIDRDQLHGVFGDAEIDVTTFDDVASAMATLGVITQFPDCPDLRNFIVLRPQWLTKAISWIMEDGELAAAKGKIPLQRMQAIWDAKGYAGMLQTFHNCMKEFELCYDLEDYGHNCLVPLRFGYVKPEIPWTVDGNTRERRVNYKLNIRPPTGLMSRFIVKTHHMIATTAEYGNGVYWHNGVFLRTGKDALLSEALCEFDAHERTLSVTVRAAFPQNMIEQIHAYVKAVFAFFAGLEPERSYGCIRVDGETKEERQCSGMHSERRIYSAILKNRILDCEYEIHDVDPQMLISGLSSFGEYVFLGKDELRRELDKLPAWSGALAQGVARLLDWASKNGQLLEQLRAKQDALTPEVMQQMQQKLREYLGYFDEMLDNRDFTSAPGIISLNTVDGSPWNPKTYFEQQYVLTPYCECEGKVHACEDGAVWFKRDRDWWKKTAPWIARGTKFLSAGLQLAFAGMPLGMPAAAFQAIENDVKFMNELAKNMALKIGDADKDAEDPMDRFDDDAWSDLRGDDTDMRVMRAALSRFLEEAAPDHYRARQWGPLCRVRMPDNSYRWLCEEHARKR